MTVSASQLNYQDDKSSLPLTIGVSGCDWDVAYTLTPSDSWIVPIPNQGTIPADDEVGITVRILRNDRALAKPGNYSGEIVIESIIGEITVKVSVEVPPTGSPGSFKTP
jgi:hypothetical protein